MSQDLPLRDGSAAPQQRPGTWLRQSNDENVIVDTANSSLHVLNDSALALWELCTGENTVDEMIAAVCELCGEPADIVRRDVTTTLARFDAAGLLRWAAP
jgi:hypothetical protein